MNRTDALIILNAITGLGSITIRKLIKYFGSAERVLSLPVHTLKETKVVSDRIVAQISSFAQDEYLKKEYDLTKKGNVRLVTYEDKDYPSNLREIADFPLVLYVKGDIPKDIDFSVAMVGSRRASIYGLNISEKFSMALAELGITVVSGMARGIDTAAHRGTLKAKGTTVAVLGCGLSTIYPAENKKLFEAISTSGAVVSEFPMETPPAAYNFPRRNRIISGLSLGVVVVEAALRSGALITSNFALEQGREVFAVPGKVDTPNAGGTNRLIKQGAKLVSSIDDILEELKPQFQNRLALSDIQSENLINEEKTIELSAEEQELYNKISDEPKHIDALFYSCSQPASKIMAVLLKLELKGLIRQMPGKMFVSNRQQLAMSHC